MAIKTQGTVVDPNADLGERMNEFYKNQAGQRMDTGGGTFNDYWNQIAGLRNQVTPAPSNVAQYGSTEYMNNLQKSLTEGLQPERERGLATIMNRMAGMGALRSTATPALYGREVEMPIQSQLQKALLGEQSAASKYWADRPLQEAQSNLGYAGLAQQMLGQGQQSAQQAQANKIALGQLLGTYGTGPDAQKTLGWQQLNQQNAQSKQLDDLATALRIPGGGALLQMLGAIDPGKLKGILQSYLANTGAVKW